MTLPFIVTIQRTRTILESVDVNVKSASGPDEAKKMALDYVAASTVIGKDLGWKESDYVAASTVIGKDLGWKESDSTAPIGTLKATKCIDDEIPF